MKRIITIVSIAMLTALQAAGQVSDALKVKTHILENGLTVWINEDPNQTAVYGAVVVKAGAVDCPGTGIAHYFEHMMFKGTDKIGTIDYQAEKPFLDSIAVLYDRLAETTDDQTRKDIQMEINRLSIKAADYAIPNEFNNLIAEMGGSGLNAFTSYDETVYHNMFLPEYFNQWAELNSERIMNPVFRLFQSELETVYEEKNMGDDGLVSDFRDCMLQNTYKGTGYTENIVGTTDNLKNPRLGQMRAFFEKYYVASNMGLVLTGNIKEAEVMPVIRKTFGRIRKGEAIERAENVCEPIVGRQDAFAKIDMPIVKLGAICFRGPSKRDEDFLAVSFLTSLLNNDAGTGLLDKLTLDHKIMLAQAMPDLSFRDAGSIMVLYMPKLLFQREKKATAHIMGAFETLKRGDFTDEYFESCKLSFKKQLIRENEDLASRMQGMAFAFSDGLDWNELLARPEKIDAMTKEDIVAIANKYFGDDYIMIHKQKGLAAKDKLQKPDYEKVVPKNREASSVYAQNLRKSAGGIKAQPRKLDYENDVRTIQIAPLVKLYAAENPYDDIFDLTFEFQTGTFERPALGRVSTYVNLLGTASETFDEIHARLQTMGSSLSVTSGENSFSITISGFDKNLEETLAIATDLLRNVKGDKKKLKQLKSEEKAGTIMTRSDMDALGNALWQKVLYGEKSPSLVDKGDFTDEALLGLFKEIQKVECDVFYSGSLDAEAIAETVSTGFDVSSVTVPSNGRISQTAARYDSPQVFFVHKKNASQSQIRCIVTSDPLDNQYDRYTSNLFGSYLGGGMSSLLFQEIREFRSMAYSTSAYFSKPYYKDRETIPGFLLSYVGTQSDKTIDAMTIVDSLVTKTPFMDKKIEAIAKELINKRCIQYPSFRDLPYSVSGDIRSGFTEDPVEIFLQVMDDASPESLKAFWDKYVAGKNMVWCIVGNSDKLDMAALEQFGPVTIYKGTDLIK